MNQKIIKKNTTLNSHFNYLHMLLTESSAESSVDLSLRENGARGIIFPSSVYRMAVVAKGGRLNFLILDWIKPTLAAIGRLFGG